MCKYVSHHQKIENVVLQTSPYAIELATKNANSTITTYEINI